MKVLKLIVVLPFRFILAFLAFTFFGWIGWVGIVLISLKVIGIIHWPWWVVALPVEYGVLYCLYMTIDGALYGAGRKDIGGYARLTSADEDIAFVESDQAPSNLLERKLCCNCNVREVMTEEERANCKVGIICLGEEWTTMCRQCWTGMATSLIAYTDIANFKLALLPGSKPMTEAQRREWWEHSGGACMRCASRADWQNIDDPALKGPNPTTRFRKKIGVRLCDSCAKEIGCEE
jgi:hypothetical protein